MDRLYKLEAAVAATATAAAGVGGSSSSGSVAGVGAGAVGAGVVVPLQEKVVTLTRANEELTVHAAKLTERLVLGEQKVATHLLLNRISTLHLPLAFVIFISIVFLISIVMTPFSLSSRLLSPSSQHHPHNLTTFSPPTILFSPPSPPPHTHTHP